MAPTVTMEFVYKFNKLIMWYRIKRLLKINKYNSVFSIFFLLINFLYPPLQNVDGVKSVFSFCEAELLGLRLKFVFI